MTNPETRLRAFQAENNIFTKGPLSLVIQFTRLVRDQTFPLNPDDFQTSGKGQVAGLGGGNLKNTALLSSCPPKAAEPAGAVWA